MKTLYQPARVEEIKQRLAQLQPDSSRLWGKMNAPQVVAHCAAGIELATGDRISPRLFLGRIVGQIIKPLALGNDEPMRRNSPTINCLVIDGERNLEPERQRLYALIDHFAAAGPTGCTKHPHAFFGKLTPEEWAELMYKHLDHHLRQFGA
jgi:hypothetical protein